MALVVDPDSLLAGLSAEQLAAVTAPTGPVVVLAGAGSGKTRVLTRRIAWRVATGDTDPQRVLALTFTRKAAAELRQRLARLGLRDRVNAGTFHSVALIQLRQRWADRGITPPAILDRRGRFIARLVTRSPSTPLADIIAEVDWARARLVGPEHYESAAAEAGRTSPLPPAQLADLLDRYQQEKRRRRVVDFDDLLALAVRDLRSDPAYAEAVRWRFRHLSVDEFQDVNALQHELLSAWRGDRPDLFLVGDPNQAIYGWNGADPTLLTRFVRREPDATVVELRDNYRSSPQVLAVAASVLGSSPLRPNRPDGPVPTVSAHPDDTAEAAAVAAAVRTAHSVGGSWSDQAVLVRTNAQLVLLDQALHAAGVPTRMRGTSGPLGTPEVRAELGRLTAEGSEVPHLLDELDERLDGDDDTSTVAAIERRANLAALSRLVHDYLEHDPDPSGPGLQAWLATLTAGDVDPDRDGVELATFHSAKGLEWPVVHVAGLEEGFVPIAYATTGAQRSEEQRLLYVALTRAEAELHLTWAAARTFGARTVRRQPSPHLGAVTAAIDRLGVGPLQRTDWRAGLARSRQALGRHAPAPASEDRLLRALRQWRARRARAADVPGHVVLTDQTLRAIVAARPSTRGGLARLPGMRPTKVERFGDDLLQLVREHDTTT